jgi:hypothetical protein
MLTLWIFLTIASRISITGDREVFVPSKGYRANVAPHTSVPRLEVPPPRTTAPQIPVKRIGDAITSDLYEEALRTADALTGLESIVNRVLPPAGAESTEKPGVDTAPAGNFVELIRAHFAIIRANRVRLEYLVSRLEEFY